MDAERRARGQPVIAVRSGWRWVGWRREQLVRAGFDEISAIGLATTGSVDLHQVLDLVAKGCPPALAVRILTDR